VLPSPTGCLSVVRLADLLQPAAPLGQAWTGKVALLPKAPGKSDALLVRDQAAPQARKGEHLSHSPFEACTGWALVQAEGETSVNSGQCSVTSVKNRNG
jgi:hypothetical protein